MRVMFDGGILDELGMEDSARVLMALLRALVEANVCYLKRHPKTPHPYRARIRYRREGKGHERWKSIPKILRDGFGDCEDLAAYLVAWYLVHGQPAKIRLRGRKVRAGVRLFHVTVMGPNGLEDPSKRLGMKGPV